MICTRLVADVHNSHCLTILHQPMNNNQMMCDSLFGRCSTNGDCARALDSKKFTFRQRSSRRVVSKFVIPKQAESGRVKMQGKAMLMIQSERRRASASACSQLCVFIFSMYNDWTATSICRLFEFRQFRFRNLPSCCTSLSVTLSVSEVAS